MDDAQELVNLIRGVVAEIQRRRAALVAVTGIDASGKGFVAARLAECLERQGVRTAVINVDGWLNLPHVRFRERDPARNFYENAIRFKEMFERLVLPLKQHRGASVEADFAEETAHAYRQYRYHFEDAHVILLEGIFLLKSEFRNYYDVAVWIDCTFETALARALARRQEGLSREDTVRAYETIYFPAQRIHIAQDRPRDTASAIFVNDPRLAHGVEP